MAERPLYTLFKNLKAQNFDVPDDYDKFESALTREGKAGADNRHAIYQSLKQQNFDVPDTYERFYTALFHPVSKDSSRANGGDVPMTAADRARFSAGARSISQSAGQTMRNAGRYNTLKQRRDRRKNDFGRVNIGTHKTPYGDADNIVKDDFAYNPETGKAGTYVTSDNEDAYTLPEAQQKQGALDEQNNAYQEAVDTGEIPSVFDVRDKNGNYDLQENIGKDGTYLTEEGADAQLKRKLDEAYARKKQIEAAIAEDNAKNGNPLLSYGASIGAGNGRDAASSDYRNKLATSLALVNEQIGSLEAVKQYPNSSVWQDAWKALDNTAFNAETWDFGLTDFAVMGQMERIKTKIDNKLPLTASEQTLLKSKLGADAAAALEDEKMGKAYRWTKIAGQSLPFMADFFMTGGYGGITRVVSKEALKYAAKKGMSKLGAAILKNTGVVAGDVIGSYAMAASTQALKTGADIMQRHLGTLYQDEDGSYKFGIFDDNGNLLHEGGETMGKALYKGLTSAMVENYTEKLFGHDYGIKKGALNFMEKHGMTRSAEFFKNLGTKDWYAGTKKWMAKFGINGFGEEVMEEEIGIPLHAILDGDNKISDLADLRQQMDIIGGMAISVGSMYALGAGMRPVKGVYNRAQYYRFKNKVNNADAAASSAFGNTEDAQQKWADLKNKIDNTPNEKMGDVMVDIIRSTGSMSKAQINAAVHYGVNLMKMRGYNLASTMQMNAKAMTGEQNTPEDQHQEKIDNAYSEGHEAEGSATHDIQQEYQLRLRNIAKMFGISEEQARSLDDTALDGMTGESDAKDMAIYQWQAAKARYQGVMDNVRDKVDTAAQEAATRADMITDKSRGTVRNAMMKGNNQEEDFPVYILGGNVSTHDDGAIDVSGSDKMIFYYDPSTGKVESCDPTRFASIGEEVNASDAKAMAVQMAREKAIREQTRDVDGRVEVGSQFTVMDQDGTQHDYEVLADNGDGTVTISIDGNVQQGNYPSLVDLQQLRDQSDGLRLTAKEAENVQNQVEGQAKAQVDQMPFDQMIDDGGKITPAIIAGEEDKMNFVTGRIGDSRLRITTLSQNKDGSYKVTNRVKKADAVQFGESMSVDDYKQMVGNEVQQEQSQNLDNNSSKLEADRGNTTEEETRTRETEAPAEEEATPTDEKPAEAPAENQNEKPAEAETAPAITLSDGTEVKMKEDGNPDLSQLTPAQVAELYDTTFEDDADQIISDRVSSTKKALDKAENMKVTGKNFTEQKANADAKKKAIAEAQAEYDAAKAVKDAYDERMWNKRADTPEGRRDLIDKAKAKYQRLKGKAENVTALWNDTVGKVLHRLYDGLGVNVFDHEPQTIEEYVSSNIAPYSLNYEGNENSKGVKQETGLERKDFAKSRVLAAEGKGQTVDEFVHKLWDNRPKQFENVSDQEIRNALLDLIMSDMNAYDMNHLIENTRIAQAEREIEDEKNEAENTRLSNETDEKSNDLSNESNESNEVPTEEQTPEDATEDKPLGEQINDVPFSARNDAQGQAQSERAESIEKNRVKDMQVVDDVVGKKTRRAFERIAKMMGATINWQYTDKMGNGWYDETTDADGDVHRTIYLTLDSSVTEGAQFIFGHEMTHEMKSVNPTSYEEFKNIIKNAYDKDFDKVVDKMEKRYSEAGIAGRDRSYYEEEVIADGIGELMRDLNLAHGIAMKMSHPLLAAIHDILMKIRRAFTGTEFVPAVEQVIRNIEQAYVATAKGTFASSSSGARFSLKDEEKAQRIEKLRESKPIEITGNEVTPSEDLKQYKKNALEYGKSLRSSYMNKDTGASIQLGKTGVKEVLNHDYKNVEQLQSVAAIPQIIENAIYIGSEENTDTEKNKDVSRYHYYVCGLKIGNKDYTVRAVVAEQPNGNRYYDHKLSNIEKNKFLDSLFGTTPEFNQGTQNDSGFDATSSTELTTANNSVGKDKKLISILQTNSQENGEKVKYSLRTKPEPKKKGIGYKVFLLGKDGKLYPPMVANPNGNATPVGVWLDADAAPIAGESKTGRPQVKQGGKGTQGGSGTLAYRPGWHLGEIPYALQFNKGEKVPNPLGIKNKKGEVIKVGKYFPKNFVFAEVEYADDVDYQDEANKEGYNENGKFVHSLAGLKHLPTDGSYKYRTNANPATDPWVITGAMKVNRILTRAEQADLVKKAGREPQQIQEGDIVSDEIVNRINQEIANAPKFSLKVYHGSGADFTEFDFDHMSEGAGSQYFGWGGYVSSSKKIGKDYAMLAKGNNKGLDFDIKGNVSFGAEDMLRHYIYKNQDITKGLDNAREDLKKTMATYPDDEIDEDIKELSKILAKKNDDIVEIKNPSYLYEVNIPDDKGGNYLDWYAPVSEEIKQKVKDMFKDGYPQSIKATQQYKDALQEYLDEGETEERFEQDMLTEFTEGIDSAEIFGDFYNTLGNNISDKGASELFSSLGYTGIKYPAGTISGGTEEGDTNYVIFKPEDMKIAEHTKFSLKSKPVRFEVGKSLSEDEKKEVLSTLKDAYKVNGVPFHIEETANGKEKRVYEPTADDYVMSDITNRPLRYYITLPDGRVAHPTEVYPNISDHEVKSSAAKQGLADIEAEEMASKAISKIYDAKVDAKKALDILNAMQELQHDTRDVGYGMNNAQSYNYKTGIFTSDSAQAIDYVVRRMRRKEEVGDDVVKAVKKAVADNFGMVDNLIDGLSETKVGAADTTDTKYSLKTDNQGNPLSADGTLKLDKIKSVDDLTDDDFLHPSRNIQMPTLSKRVADAIGVADKPVIIKKNIFERNYMRHKDVTPEQSKAIFNFALYNPDLYGQNQKAKRPYNWVLINTKDEEGKNRTVLLEVNPNKDNVEIVHWYFVNNKNLELIKKQAIREGDQILILPSEQSEEVGGLSNLTDGLSGAKIDNSSETTKENGEKFSLRLKNAIDETDTNPSDVQKESGNYKKGHVKFGGYDFTIENPKGSTRSGKDADGKEWKVSMHDTYGYIRGKFGKDGDHLDMFINDDADLDNWHGNVYVVDQKNADGSFDEHKVMYGFDSEEDAKKAYLSNYSKGWKGLGSITGVSKEDFDKWVDSSKRKMKPFADHSIAQNAVKAPETFEEFLVHPALKFSIRNEAERKAAENAYNFAMENRPDESKQYAIVDMSHEGRMPEYFEKKALAKSWSEYYNKVVTNDWGREVAEPYGNYKLFDLDKPFQDQVNKVEGKVPDKYEAVGKRNPNADNESGATYRNRYEQGEPSSVTYKDRYEAFKKAVAETSARFSLKGDKTLAGVHNITEDKLRRALKLGGLANPSLAVIDTDKASHNNFGEISLIAPSALVDKRTGKTAGTWTTDAYTQRYPSVERQMTDKGYEKFKKWVDGLEYSSADKSEILRQTKAVLEDNGVPAWELMYLKEKGIDLKAYDSDVDYRWQEIIENHPTAKEILDAMKSDPELNDKVTKLAKSAIVMPTWSDISKQVRKQIYEDTGAKVAPINPKVRAQVKEIFERDYAPQLLNKDGSPRKADVKKVVEDMVKQYDDTKKYSFYKSKVKASSYVNSNGLYPDYIRWQENKLDEFGTKNRIFRGYKNDGTRKYVPETLENVSKAMREDANEQTNGGEYTSFGSFIAKLADRVDSTEEMRANKDKLASNEDKEAFYNKWEEVYYDLAKSLYNDLMYGEQRLHDIVVQPDPKKYAKKEYGITLTASFMKKLNALKDAVQNELKSGYFETKFDRPVRLNEFVAAVVPNNLGDDVRKGLEKAGLSLYEYNPNEESGRQRAFDEAANSSDEIKFSLKQERESIVEDAKKNGTYMLAPNGKKTKLDAEQWANVRTDNFKKWFGDWENDPENASKVVDENGEPMVVYHGRSTDFNTFEKKEGVRFVMGFEDKVKADGFFFSPDKGFAEEFAGNAARHRGGKANVVPCFLNIRKPLDLVSEDYDKRYEDVTGWSWVVGMDSQDNLWEIMDEEGMADKMKAKGYDGAIFVEEVDDNYEPTQISYCALDANQIKSADNNNGDYSADNNDIRFSLKAMDDNPEGWKQANKKAIHIAEAIERDPKFSLKELEGTLIKAGTYFSGGGLVEEGLKGIIDPVVAVEYDEKISGVYRNNFGQHLVTADVRDVDPKELVKNIDGEVEYFHASPVCKNFSQAKANHEEVELDKETAKSTADFINEVKPKVVTIENVKGYRDSEAMKTITDALDKNGYKWDADVYNAADYGGYTNRERLIVRAVKDGELPEKPKKMDRKKGWYEAVEDIMPTLTEKKNGVAPWMDTRLKADGIDWKHIDKPLYVMGSAYADGKVPHAFGDELLPTLRTKSGDVIVMPDGKVYRSSGRVLARVSGVSDDYKMPYSEALSHTIIGNGIPTQLTEHVIAPLLTSRDPKFSLRGYHGTGAKFDRFDLSHALEGEGSESFGHGVYVTSSAEIGKAYAERAKLDKISKWINNDNNIPAKYRDMDIKPDYRRIARGVYEGEPLEKMKAEAIRENEMEVDNIKSIIQRWERGEEDPFYTENYLLSHHLPSTKENREKYRQEVIDGYKEDLAIYDKVIKTIRGMKEEDFADVPRSYRYDVEIPDDNGENYLSWKGEIPSSLDREELADRVFVDAMLGDTYKGVSKDYKEKVREDIKAKINKCKTGKDLHEVLSFYGDKETVSEELSDFGFVGIKYPAGTIHGGAKEGDTNYVIFDEDNAKIVGNTKFSLRRSDYEKALSKWKKENNLPKDAKRPVMPQQKQGESQFDYMLRVNKYLVENALWKTAPRYEGHLMTGPSAQAQFNRELQRRSVLTRIAVQDAMLAIRKAQEAIAKEAGIDHIGIGEDAYTAENRSHGKAKNEFEEYNQVFLEPLRKSYHKLMLALDHSYDNVKVYMIAKHGLERNRVMAFRDALANDYEENAAALTQYYNYMVDVDKLQNDVDFETGKIDYVTWWQNDDSIRVKYAPSYLDKRYNQQTGRPNDYAGLSSLFDGDDYEAKAYNMVHDVETAFPAETAELWKNTNLATKRVLRNSLDAGMMTKETFDYVNSMFQNYIPLRGWNDTTADDVWDYVGGGKGAFNEALKSAKGRTSLADDPIAYIENMAESGILINNRNWVKQHLLLLAENHPENTLLTLSKAWYVKTKDSEGNDVWMPSSPNIPASMTDPAKIKDAIKKWLDTMERLRTNGEAKQQREGLNIVYPQTNYEERQHEVRVMRNGEEYVIYVNGDPQLAQAINNSRARRVRETQDSMFEKFAAKTGRAMAAVYTSMSPLFVPANFFRDLTMTMASTAIREDARYNILLRKNFLTTWDTFKLVKEYQNGSLREKVANGSANADEKMFYDYMMKGGETGFISTMDINDFKEKIHRELKDLDRRKVNPKKAFHAIMEGIEYLNRVVEGSNRFLIYKTSIQYGRSVEEAINNAKDVTLNFNRKGTGEESWQTFRNLYLFVNPAVQSLQTLGALAKHHPIKFTAVTTAWMMSGMLAPMLNQLLLEALGGDDDKDKYWSFSRYDRRNNFIMWVPGTKMFLKVPISQEFRPFYSVGDMIASKMSGNDNVEETWKEYACDLLGEVAGLSPIDPTSYDGDNWWLNVMPNFARPILELAANVDFTGKPLFNDSDYNKYDPNWTKAYAGTPDWLVRISRMVNSIQNDYPDEQQNFIDSAGSAKFNLNNPAVVHHLLSGYLGGAYTLGSQVIGAITKALNDPKDFKTADVPFFSKFVSNPDDRPLSKKKGEEFWHVKDEQDRVANTIRNLKKNATASGDFSQMEKFFGTDEYKEYKANLPKMKKYDEERKLEKLKETGDEDTYKPHKITADDIYNAHATASDDFEDLKMKLLWKKAKALMDKRDVLGEFSSQGDEFYNEHKAMIDAAKNVDWLRGRISENKKMFLSPDGKDAFDAKLMKEIRGWRKEVIKQLESADKAERKEAEDQ